MPLHILNLRGVRNTIHLSVSVLVVSGLDQNSSNIGCQKMDCDHSVYILSDTLQGEKNNTEEE